MAVSANNAAFIPVRGLGDGVSQDVKYWNQDAANKRQEARIDDQIAYRKQQDTNQANLDLYNKHIKSNVPWDTGSKSENEVVAKGLQMITEQYGPLITTMMQNPPGSEKYLKAILKMDGLNSWAEQTKLVTDKIKGRHENIIKLASEGKIKKNAAYDNYLKAFDNGFATFELGADEQGKMFIAYKDLDKDGVDDLIGVETFDEVSKGQSLFKFDANYDADADAKAIAGEVGTFKKQTDSNFTKVETSGFDTERLQTRVSEHLFDANGALTAEAISYMQDLNYEDNPTNREKMVESFTAKVNSFNKTTDITTVDNSGITGRGNQNLNQQRFNRENSQEDGKNPTIEVDLDKDGKPIKVTPPGGTGKNDLFAATPPSGMAKPFGADEGEFFSLSPSTPITAGTKDQPIIISKIFINEKGEMSYSGKKKTGDESYKEGDTVIKQPIYQDVNGSPLNESDLNSLSRLIKNPNTKENFKNYSELSTYFKGKTKESENSAPESEKERLARMLTEIEGN